MSSQTKQCDLLSTLRPLSFVHVLFSVAHWYFQYTRTRPLLYDHVILGRWIGSLNQTGCLGLLSSKQPRTAQEQNVPSSDLQFVQGLFKMPLSVATMWPLVHSPI